MNQLSYLAIHTKSEKISHFQLRKNPVLITALTSLLFPAQLRLKPCHQGLIGQDLVITLVKPPHGTTMLFQMPPLKCEAMTHIERGIEIIWNPKFNLVSVKGLWWSCWIKKVSCFRIMIQDSVGLDILGYTRRSILAAGILASSSSHGSFLISAADRALPGDFFWLESQRVQTLRACSCSQKMAPVVPKVLFSYSNSI